LSDKLPMASRFRGFLPVVIDVECGGFNPNTDALLEIAAVLIEIQGDGTRGGILEVRGMPSLEEGRVYQAWVQRDGMIEPEPTFMMRPYFWARNVGMAERTPYLRAS